MIMQEEIWSGLAGRFPYAEGGTGADDEMPRLPMISHLPGSVSLASSNENVFALGPAISIDITTWICSTHK